MKIIKRSNIIQYDVMGYPLRLCIVSTGKNLGGKRDQMWIDTTEREGDVVLQWNEGEEMKHYKLNDFEHSKEKTKYIKFECISCKKTSCINGQVERWSPM